MPCKKHFHFYFDHATWSSSVESLLLSATNVPFCVRMFGTWTASRSLLIVTLAVISRKGAAQFAVTTSIDVCPVLGCCVDDCCAKGTSWDLSTSYCIADPSSDGFSGTYISDYEAGCVDRICCEDACCGDGTKYDSDLACCVPLLDAPTPAPTLLGIDDSCREDSECETDYCYYGFGQEGAPGICRCNPDSMEGCPDGTECVDSIMIQEAQGIADKPPTCFIPAGFACSENSSCLSGNCYNNVCECSEFSNYPCTADEICTLGDAGYACLKIPPPLLGLDEPCRQDSECETDNCFYGFIPPGSPGSCRCNPDTNEGCSDGKECADPELIIEAQRIADFPPTCFLPMGSECSGSSSCLSGNCYNNICVCNDFSNYPCTSNEICTLGDEGYACIADPA